MGISLFLGGSKRLPRWFGALTVFGSIQPCRVVKMARIKVPQSARMSAGGGVQSLFGQCPNGGGVKILGSSLKTYLISYMWNCEVWCSSKLPPRPENNKIPTCLESNLLRIPAWCPKATVYSHDRPVIANNGRKKSLVYLTKFRANKCQHSMFYSVPQICHISN